MATIRIPVLGLLCLAGAGCSRSPRTLTPQPDAGAAAAQRTIAADPGALKPIMVGVGANMGAIYAALWQEDYGAIARLAAAIARHPSISAAEVQRIRATLGDEYVGFVQDDHRVHRSAARLAEAARNGDEQSTLDELAALQRGCVRCHTHYRFKLAR